MKIRHYTQHHITLSLARSGALLMLLLLFSIGYLQPGEVNAAAITCSAGVSGCHFAPTTTPMIKDGTGRNTPTGRFTGSHARHSGYSTSSAKREYQYACTVCHGLAGGYNNAHQTGFKNVSSSSLPGNRYSAGKRIANTNTPAFGNCGNISCHSNGRATGMGQAQFSSARWGGTKTCLGCHGGRASATGAPARSIGNFTLSTTHSQHLKYPAANMNCQICHAKTTQTNAWTLKTYTAATHHVNGVRDVTFTDVAYASYTSYKSTESGSSANTKVCTNTSCHGGSSRSAWSATALNNDNTCAHCHGISGTTSGTDKRAFAPGFRKTGISTDGTTSSNNIRVGSHFKHLSSAYMKNIKCNECHQVPYTPFQVGTNHTLNTTRFNSGTLTFGQASSARWNGATSTHLATFAGYTNGTAVKAATCSSVYCHGSRLKFGDTGGIYTNRRPYWNYSAMINYTNKDVACGRCHGNPPASVSAQHSGKAATTSCSTCHGSVVNSSGVIINKALHLNGSVEATSGHSFPYPGATHSVAAGATNPASNCSCHDYTTAGTYPVTAGTAPKCLSCHTAGLYRAGTGTQSCYDCHGASATDGTPNAGTTFPNWSGSHKTHVTGQGMACSDCHSNGGTGNTAHGHSNGVAKTRTTVNVQQGGTATFSYAAATRTCSTVSCHGTAVWSVTQFDCLGCHTAANGAVRAVTPELGSSSAYQSHHITGIATTKWHCIVCHAEGDNSTGGTVSSLHKNGTVELRNVDNEGNPGTLNTHYWSMPATMTAAAYANLDTFCFRCHDAGGAAGIAMSSATALTTAPSGAQAQNPFADTRSNSYDQQTRSVVLDVDSQFTSTNPSHHAVKGRKYSSTGTQYLFNASKFNTYNTKEGTQVKDGSLLHCHDCHYENGHGTANNEYMLQNSSGADTLHTSTTYVCFRCHISSYGDNTAHTGGATSDFKHSAGLDTLATRTGSKGHVTGMTCSGCHGGMTGWGGIHGMTGTYTDQNSATQTKYRFMPGMANSGYAPAGWTGAGRSTQCYTPSNTSWSGCTSHSTASKATAVPLSTARPLSY